MGFGRRLVVVAVLAMFVAAIPAAALATYDNPGTGTQGYWKNHPDAWPVDEIEIGGETYTKTAAITWMNTPGKGDKTIDLFKQLVAAKLNVEIGNDPSCISWAIYYADRWFGAPLDLPNLHDNALGSGVKANSGEWKIWGSDYHEALDDYNNGRLCAPHRD